MSEGRRTTLLAYLTRLGCPASAEDEDAALLERFAAARDETAFTSLLRRHGPLVWGICRRVLGEEQAAEDAFQATFLVLVRKAHSVSKKASIRSWLYGVALRVALRARRRESLRRDREQGSPARTGRDACAESDWQDVRPVLDEEIQSLPEKYRLPVILCYLEGKTNDEAARLLDCSRGTIATRLARARDRLRSRLVRRGLTLSAGGLATLLSENVLSATVPPLLFSQTTKVVLGGTTTVAITTLTEGMLRDMFTTKLKMALVVILALTAMGGAGASVYYLRAQAPALQPEHPAKKPEKEAQDKKPGEQIEARLQKLLKDRRDMAEQELRVLREQFQEGSQAVSLDMIVECSKRLLKAELESSNKKADRLAAYERHLGWVNTYVKAKKAMFEAGRTSPAELARAEYERLDVEIELEREKARK
jgi:RNA polymerase sigma factor (sigma-70 family)